MENKQVNEKINENVTTTETKEIETIKKLFLERESFIANNGETYWAYLLKGEIRNKVVKVDFAPKDKGGYEPLDFVFFESNEAELIIGEESMSDNNGKVTKYNTYTARTIDKDGFVYECGVKPARDSDKALLKMILNQMGVK